MFSPSPGRVYLQRLWDSDREALMTVLVLERHEDDTRKGSSKVLITYPDGRTSILNRFRFRFPIDQNSDSWRVI